MNDSDRKLPVGIQSFEKLREQNCVYVDKTAYIYKLVHQVTPFFLSRPRRFGKSLLLSTLLAYWEGKKELFTGLEIEELEAGNPDAWKQYPVLYFDFNGENYNKTSLEQVLAARLKRWEEQYGIEDDSETLGERFQNLLIRVHVKTGLRCVVLVDEYDKPLLDLIGDSERQEHNKAVFKGFFSNLKACDNEIQFVFITGVTKFHKVSIFSDLNQLNDISLHEDFAGLCGITESEIAEYLSPDLCALAQKLQMNEADCMSLLKEHYDGYHFCAGGVEVYNPFSLLKAFYEKKIGAYWFETGSPTFLVKQLRERAFDVRRFTDQTIYASESSLMDYTGDDLSVVSLLYQTGYLTIIGYDANDQEYTLAFPNKEVKYGFLESMLPEYIPDCVSGSGLDIFTLRRYVKEGNLDQIRNVLTALFARIPYTAADSPFEHYFQTVIYLVFTLLGKYALCEIHTFSGRIDCKVETDRYVYLFEFKRDESAEKAIRPIEDKDYVLPFAAENRRVFKIGVSFDSETRSLADWKAVEC